MEDNGAIENLLVIEFSHLCVWENNSRILISQRGNIYY